MVGDRQSANLARTILFNRKAYLQRTLPHQPYQSHHVGLGDLHEALAFVMRLRCWIHQSNSELLKRWLGHLSLHGFSTSVYYWYIYIHIHISYWLFIYTDDIHQPIHQTSLLFPNRFLGYGMSADMTRSSHSANVHWVHCVSNSLPGWCSTFKKWKAVE